MSIKKMIEIEKWNNFEVWTLYAHEIESKKKLENILKFSIEDVRNEITKKKTEKSDIYKA